MGASTEKPFCSSNRSIWQCFWHWIFCRVAFGQPLVIWGGCQKLLESPRVDNLLSFFTALIWGVFIRTFNTFQFRRRLRNGGLAQVGSIMLEFRRVYRCPSHIRIPLFGARDGWVPVSHGGIRSARWGAQDSGCQNSSRQEMLNWGLVESGVVGPDWWREPGEQQRKQERHG